MNRIDKKFKDLKKQRKKALIVYITAGDPMLAATEKYVLDFEKAGVDIIELGVPFSDPLADGPTIQAASQRALEGGVTLARIFTAVERLRKKTDIPLVFMTYFNPVLRYGLERFFKRCVLSGVDGIIIPDLSYEEAGDVVRFGRQNKIATIFLIAPTSTPKRIKAIGKVSSGFIYYVSLTGVTGARKRLSPEIYTNVKRIKKATKKNIAVGFGVSDASSATRIAGMADGVIVGSAIVKLIGGRKGHKRIFGFVEKLSKAVHNAGR